jgi:Anti-sigma-K factor rskA/Putative zinc-finger
MEPLVTCDDCDLLLAADAVGSIDPRDQDGLRVHLAGCPACREAAAAYAHTAGLLPLALDPVMPPASLRSRLLARVHSEAAGEVRPPPRPSRVGRLWRALPTGRGLTLAGGLAGMAAAVLAVWSFAVPHRTAAPPAVLVSRACGLTPLPSACGELAYTRSTHAAVLTLTGLPPLPVVNQQPIGTYEAWLIRPDGSADPGAYLSPAPDGRTWSAVLQGDISTYQAVATTREPHLGDVVPSGPELIRIPRPAVPGTR